MSFPVPYQNNYCFDMALEKTLTISICLGGSASLGVKIIFDRLNVGP